MHLFRMSGPAQGAENFSPPSGKWTFLVFHLSCWHRWLSGDAIVTRPGEIIEPNMKTLKLLALIVCTAAIATGCASSKCCAKKETSASCGMKCCSDAKTDCAHCATCSAKK